MLRHIFTSALGAATALIIAIVATTLSASAGGRDPMPPKGGALDNGAAASDIVGSAPSRVYTRAKVSFGSVNLKNLSGGAIYITDLTRPVQQAFLYWSVVSKGAVPELARSLRIQRIFPYPVTQDVEIRGIAIGTIPDPCQNTAKGGATSTIFRAMVPLAVANGNGAYVIQLNPTAASSRPTWSGASLVIVGSGSGKVELFDSNLAGKSFFSRSGRTARMGTGNRQVVSIAGPTDGGDCLTPVANIVEELPASPEGLAVRVAKPDLTTSHRAPGARARLPDLVVSSGNFQSVTGNRVIVGHVPATFEWTQLTENRGSATAAKSKTNVSIDLGVFSIIPGQSSIPKLLPGKFFSSAKNVSLDIAGEEFGTYPVSICADSGHRVNESDESNNCKKAKPIHVVPRSFTGRVKGETKIVGSVFITWIANVTYNQTAIVPLGDGVNVDYTFTNANVDFEVSGTNTGCRWSGKGTDHPPVQGIRLFFDKTGSSYFAANFNTAGFSIKTTIRCPNIEPLIIPTFPSAGWFFTGSKTFANPGLLEFEDDLRAPPHKYSWVLLPSG